MRVKSEREFDSLDSNLGELSSAETLEAYRSRVIRCPRSTCHGASHMYHSGTHETIVVSSDMINNDRVF